MDYSPRRLRRRSVGPPNKRVCAEVDSLTHRGTVSRVATLQCRKHRRHNLIRRTAEARILQLSFATVVVVVVILSLVPTCKSRPRGAFTVYSQPFERRGVVEFFTDGVNGKYRGVRLSSRILKVGLVMRQALANAFQ